MLYTTTRSDHDTYTAERALKERCAPDGGLYLPMQRKRFSPGELAQLLSQEPTGVIVSVLNHFFSSKLTAKDVEFSLGREFIRLPSLSRNVTAAEYWRNADGDFSRIQRILTERVAIDKRSAPVGEWAQTATRIAMLFAAYAQMHRDGRIEYGKKLDVAVLSGSFSGPVAAWMARDMGLPIGNIICCCNENGAAWDLLQRGEMKLNPQVRRTKTPRCDVGRPEGVERLVRLTLGVQEANRYAYLCEEGGVYELRPEQHEKLRAGMYASVSSDIRVQRVIANAYATNGYVLCPYSALVYSGLMDYRAATGHNGPALMISETSPLQCEEQIAKAMGVTVAEVHERLGMA